MEKLRINHLPGQTWNRLGMNDVEVENVPFSESLMGECREESAEKENDSPAGLEKACAAKDNMDSADALEGIGSALGEEFLRLLERSEGGRSIMVTAPAGKVKTYRAEFGAQEGAKSGLAQIHALPGSELNVYEYFGGSAEKQFSQNRGDGRADGREKGQNADRIGIRNVILAERGARVKLVQIFLPGGRTEVLNDIGAKLEEGATLEVDQIFLGGKNTVSGTLAELQGRRSAFVSNIAYDVAEGEKLDLNVIARHAGKKTEAQIDVKGVLRKGSHKLLRATVDFLTGCSGSVGKENEEVLLMDENVVNQTIPLILCGEEDVEGAHGASIGRIDEEHLFYLKSRGIPEDRIYEMLANARIEAILGRIGDAETTERVQAALETAKGGGLW